MLTLKKDKEYEENIELFGKTVNSNIHYISQACKKLRNHYSVLFFICGGQRVGKSFLGLWLMYFFNTLFDKPTEPKSITFYEMSKMADKLDKLNRMAFMIDEAGAILSRREWFKRSHQDFDKLLQSQQYKQFVFILISPFISDIDAVITKHFDFILRVDDRGKYKAFKVYKKYDALDIKESYRRGFLDNCSIKKTSIPKDIWNKYEEFSFKQKELLRKGTDKQTIANLRLKEEFDHAS